MFAHDRIIPRFGTARDAALRFRAFDLFGAVLRNRRDVVVALVGIGAVSAIAINGLFLQSGPHPAPIFAVRPRPVIFAEATGAVAQLPRPRPPAASALRPEAPRGEPVPLPRARPQAALSGARPDPIADIINPARQLSALQRMLNDFGYGPIKVTGSFDEETSKGIERFERDHNLAVSGQNTPQLRHALGLATGRPLD
jgi:hypothetical protein